MKYLYLVLLISISDVSYSENTSPQMTDNIDEIVNSVEKLCKAPTHKKSTYYEIQTEGNVNVKVKLLGLAGGSASFKKEHWHGVQRVLRKHQADDNKSFRECSIQLTPIFIEKYYKIKIIKNKNKIHNDDSIKKKQLVKSDNEKSPEKSAKIIQETYGDKSPVINDSTGNININYN